VSTITEPNSCRKLAVALLFGPGFAFGMIAPATAQPATAQSAGEQTETSAVNTPESDNKDIVVTATRREGTVNSVPLSIQALSSKALAEQGAYDFNSYARSITGLSALDRGPGQQLITIRGISSDTSATNTDAPESKETTAIYFDETPVSLAGFNPDLQLVDIDRVEVLKGPQGTLFGAGALAGAIRVIGKKPDLAQFGGSTEIEGSSYQGGSASYAGNLTVNLPIVVDKVALRVVGYDRRDGGFIDNVGLTASDGTTHIDKNVNTARTYGVRGQLRIAPLEMFDINLKVVRQHTELDGTQNVDQSPLADGSPNPEIPTGLILSKNQQYRPGTEPYRDGITILSSDATLRLPGIDVISSTSYVTRQQNAQIDFTGAIPVLFGIAALRNPGLLLNQTRARDFVQEVRLVSSDIAAPFQWILGAFYDNQHKVFSQNLVSEGVDADNGGALGSDTLLHTVARFRDRQYAAFGEASYRMGSMTATAGLRYFNFRSIFSEVGDGAALGGPLTLADRTTKDHGFNPKFNVSWKPGKHQLFYAQATRGFRLGGINDPLLAICSLADAATYVDDFKSDHLWNYEVGAKLGWLDGKLQTNISAYHIDWRNVPITRQLACGVSNTITAGAVRIDGVEFDANAQLATFWRIAGGFSYTDSRIHTIDPTVSAQTGIVAGEHSAGIAPWNANFTSTFEASIPSGYRLYANANYQYVGSIYNYPGTFDPRRTRQSPYSIVNLRLGTRVKHWDISLFANNLFDKRAVLFHDRILGETRDTINRPRSIGMDAKVNF
jgi:iron complex outermembrane receptor protein